MYACWDSPQKKTVQKTAKVLAVFLLFLTISLTSKAQVGEFYYGMTDRDEVANDVKRTTNGNAVIVGYSTTSSAITDRDFFITLINSTGGVVWTRMGGSQTGDVLESVVVKFQQEAEVVRISAIGNWMVIVV